MKKLLLTLLVLTSLPSFANSIACQSEDEIWFTSFKLDGDIITDLRILKNGTPIVSRDKIEGIKTRIFKTEFYEFDLGAPRYFDFEKRINSKVFEASFYLKKHPFGFEINVLCKKLDETI